MLGVLNWLACGAAEGEGASPPETPAYVYEGSSQTLVVDPVQMSADLQSLVDDLRGTNARPVLAAWWGIRELGDELCPHEEVVTTPENGTSTYFDGLCMTREIVAFKGPMTTWEVNQDDLGSWEVGDIAAWLQPEGITWQGRAIRGQTDVYSLDGSVDYNCSCTAIALEGTAEDGHRSWASYVDGPTHTTGPEDDGTWVERGDQANVGFRLDEVPGGARQAHVSADRTRGDAIYGNIALHAELSRDEAGVCSGSAEVTMRHTETARRVSMTLEVGPDCEACATLDEGDVCVSLAPVLDWEEAPW